VGDDFTGAGDAASFLANRGIRTMLFTGVPQNAQDIQGCNAVVIALKSRNAPAAQAVADTKNALLWLRRHHAGQLYIKYCSTFDSTPQGNIGPAVDCALEICGVKYTALCPSLPVNGRIVRNGELIVDGIPLDESSMKDHPLNPMWDSSIPRLMESQGKYPCLVLGAEWLAKTKEEIESALEDFGRNREHFYVVPDYCNDEQGKRIAEVFGELAVLTGGSGLMEHLAGQYLAKYNLQPQEPPAGGAGGKGIVLSGSCSGATKKQIKAFIRDGGPALGVSPGKLLSGEQTPDSLLAFIRQHSEEEVLLYSDGALAGRDGEQDEETRGREAKALEEALSIVALSAFRDGYTRIIVAGGETSGAVVLRLGFNSFLIGKSIAPGVPVMIPVSNRSVRLVLKSGNFGQPDFFRRALRETM
jgi:uncharacterized protein YgbK (DUF1537 family)